METPTPTRVLRRTSSAAVVRAAKDDALLAVSDYSEDAGFYLNECLRAGGVDSFSRAVHEGLLSLTREIQPGLVVWRGGLAPTDDCIEPAWVSTSLHRHVAERFAAGEHGITPGPIDGLQLMRIEIGAGIRGVAIAELLDAMSMVRGAERGTSFHMQCSARASGEQEVLLAPGARFEHAGVDDDGVLHLRLVRPVG